MREEQEVQGKGDARPPYRKLSQKVGEERDKWARRGAVLSTGSPADQVPRVGLSPHPCNHPASDTPSQAGAGGPGEQPRRNSREVSSPTPSQTIHYPTGPENWSSRLYLSCSWLVLGSLVIVKLFQSSQKRGEEREGLSQLSACSLVDEHN